MTAAAASVSFPTIPAAYRMFRVTGQILNDSNVNSVTFQLNGDSGSNYDNQKLQVNATTVDASRTTGQTSGFIFNGGNNIDDSESGSFQIHLVKQQTTDEAIAVVTTAYMDNQGTSAIRKTDYNVIWKNTDALISQINIIKGSGNFAVNTMILLEGNRA